ncbi:Ku protein [Streptomyces phaeochromogenes]|uniref:non-homologous end joining protein Ku n=1 Tax=Streptomyces phaeochromogenes TaxID=1923 RepID=UPI0038684631|nr:Ku protein [Streptomyces phaeochromogenes]
MPHAIWNGAVSFGLVSIPIRVMAATENHSITFHQYHLADMARIRTRKVCEIEDREVGTEEIGKAYELDKDHVIPISDDELAAMPLPTARAIEIVAFIPYESIDPIRIGEGYYLEANGPVAGKPYVLLRKALERSAKVAVAKFALRGRERLGLLRVRGDAIVLHAMKWDDEIRDPAALAPKVVEVTDDEIEGAELLIDRMTRDDLQGPEFVDHYTDALAEVIKAKREGKAPPEAPEQAAPAGEVVDLMTALRESVAKAKTSRGEDATVHEMPTKKTASKKAAQKARARKAAAKKTTTKKTAAKKASRKPRSA